MQVVEEEAVGVCRVVQQVGCAGGCVQGGAAGGVCKWWKRRRQWVCRWVCARWCGKWCVQVVEEEKFLFSFSFFFFFPNVAQKIIASVVFNDTPLLITRLITSLELSLFLKKARTNFPFYCFVSCNENVVFGIMTWCWI